MRLLNTALVHFSANELFIGGFVLRERKGKVWEAKGER
jgi:hypothetical protein